MLLAVGLVTPVTAQNKFEDAISRSEAAGRIVDLLAVVPESGFPRELMDRAEAIGIFPKVEKTSSLFTQVTSGYGVISARSENGWTMPAFYSFGGAGFGSPFAKNDKHAIILLFMTKDAIAAFEKGGVKLKGDRKAVSGPVGAIDEEKRTGLKGAHVIAYAYFNGELKGVSFGNSSWKSFALNPDNNINQPLYGMKGREVLAGTEVKVSAIPPGITPFFAALEKHYPVVKRDANRPDEALDSKPSTR